MNRRVIAATAAVILLAGPLDAGRLAAQRGWTFVRAPQADLWFHGLAIVGFRGFGPLPLYDRDYGATVRRVKDSLGVGGTALDRQADRFRAEFDEDSSFEVLHFVPLYFAAADPALMLATLRAVARQPTGIPAFDDPRVRFGAAAVATALPTRAERRILGEYVEALDGEWREFYAAYWSRESTRAARRVSAVQAEWGRRFAPALAAYLHATQLDGGIVFLSPALGADGRIFEGNPADRGDNLVAVRFPADDDSPAVPLAATVRELCYPALRRALQLTPVSGDRIEEERVGSDATVRCGAMLLQRYAPDRVAAYRRAFASDTLAAPFETAYPLDRGLTQALARFIP